MHAIAAVLQERVAIRGQLHDEFRHFYKNVRIIRPKLKANSGFIDLKDYDDAKTLWAALKDRTDVGIDFYKKKGGLVKEDCETFEKIFHNELAEIEVLLEKGGQQID